MKAVMYRQYGGPEVLEYCDVADPTPGPGEVLVAVKACSLNRTLDIETRERAYMQPPLPHIGGVDPAGEVVSLGPGVEGCKPGDRVGTYPLMPCKHCRYCLSGRSNLCEHISLFGVHRHGGFAQYTAVPASCLIPLPAHLPYYAAAALGLSYPTAWHLLVGRAHVGPSDTVLVLAAGSGMGVAGIQIAKLFGSRVIAAASTQRKLDLARSLGADATINYAEEDFSEAAREMTDGVGVDVVYENIGSATWDKSVAAMAKGGRLVTCGTHTGSAARIDIRNLYFREISLLFSVGALCTDVHQVYAMAGQGRLQAVIDTTFPLQELRAAQQRLLDREQFGKIIIHP